MNNPLIVLAPSKRMEIAGMILNQDKCGSPLFLTEAAILAGILKSKSEIKLMKLLGISKSLAKSVHEQYALWPSGVNTSAALWTYKGDVYRGLLADSLSASDATWAQQHLIIVSALYGILRPFDIIKKYRLEMNTKVRVHKCQNPLEFWGTKLSEYPSRNGYTWICICSSSEYARPIIKQQKLPVVIPMFMDHKKNGEVAVVPIYSKLMRGVFARWIIENRITEPEQLASFSAHGYMFDEDRSVLASPVFVRATMSPLRF